MVALHPKFKNSLLAFFDNRLITLLIFLIVGNVW